MYQHNASFPSFPPKIYYVPSKLRNKRIMSNWISPSFISGRLAQKWNKIFRIHKWTNATVQKLFRSGEGCWNRCKYNIHPLWSIFNVEKGNGTEARISLYFHFVAFFYLQYLSTFLKIKGALKERIAHRKLGWRYSDSIQNQILPHQLLLMDILRKVQTISNPFRAF